MKEFISIKDLNNKINKLFEDELEDVKIIKDIKDVITRYENDKDYKLKLRLASKLRSLSTQLRDFQRNNINKDNTLVINKLIDYIGKNNRGNDYNHDSYEDGLNAWIGKNAKGEVISVQFHK